MNPAKEEYRRPASKLFTRGRKFPSNFAEIPQPTPASLGVETACTGIPLLFNTVMKSSVCARDLNTANVVMIATLPSYNKISSAVFRGKKLRIFSYRSIFFSEEL